MNLSRLLSRKAISPVISIVFLTGIMVAAVAVSLGIIFPQMQKINDNMELINAASAVELVDSNIKSLISSGVGGKTSTTLELGSTGYLNTNFNALSTLYFMKTVDGLNPTILDTFYLPHNRMLISQTIKQDVFAINSHQYLEGSGGQNVFFLNDTLKAQYPWVILNQSRGVTDQVNTTISYRSLLTPTKKVDILNGKISLTITLQYIKLNFPGNTIRSGHNPNVRLEYTTLNVTTSAITTVVDVPNSNVLFYLKINTVMDGFSRIEIPIQHETPTDGTLEITLQFVVHEIDVNF